MKPKEARAMIGSPPQRVANFAQSRMRQSGFRKYEVLEATNKTYIEIEFEHATTDHDSTTADTAATRFSQEVSPSSIMFPDFNDF